VAYSLIVRHLSKATCVTQSGMYDDCLRVIYEIQSEVSYMTLFDTHVALDNKGNNKITELRTVNNRKTVKTVMTLTWQSVI
jgi:hypothetical protein